MKTFFFPSRALFDGLLRFECLTQRHFWLFFFSYSLHVLLFFASSECNPVQEAMDPVDTLESTGTNTGFNTRVVSWYYRTHLLCALACKKYLYRSIHPPERRVVKALIMVPEVSQGLRGVQGKMDFNKRFERDLKERPEETANAF